MAGIRSRNLILKILHLNRHLKKQNPKNSPIRVQEINMRKNEINRRIKQQHDNWFGNREIGEWDYLNETLAQEILGIFLEWTEEIEERRVSFDFLPFSFFFLIICWRDRREERREEREERKEKTIWFANEEKRKLKGKRDRERKRWTDAFIMDIRRLNDRGIPSAVRMLECRKW